MLKLLFYVLWVSAGAIAGLFMRFADAKQRSGDGNKLSLALTRVATLLAFVFLVGAAMEITGIISFGPGEMIPGGLLCIGACVVVYFWGRAGRK